MSASGRHALCALVATIGVTGALVTAQRIVADRVWRLDLTPERRHVLSNHARQILAALDRPVTVTYFLRAEDPRNREGEDLLRRVAAASPQVRVHSVDINRNPALARQYGVDAYGTVVVESEGRRQDFPNPDEQTLTAAIVHVTRPGRRRIYFLTGHGERGIADRDRRRGYSYARVALLHELYEVDELQLADDTPVPADAAALIVAGPRRNLSAPVLQQIDAYVRRGGGLLALLDPGDAPDLATLLQRYGVAVSEQPVVDEQNRLFAGDFLTVLVPGRSTAHPVGAGLNAPPLMSQVRTVTTVATELRLAGVDVLKTAPESWRSGDPEVLRTGVTTFVDGRDAPGPVPVAAAVLVRGDTEDTPGRVLVCGDADFAANFFLNYLGNRDLLLNAVNWLAGEDTMVASRAPPQEPGINQLFISERQGRIAFLLGTVAQPAAMLLLGALVYFRRRRG